MISVLPGLVIQLFPDTENTLIRQASSAFDVNIKDRLWKLYTLLYVKC